MLKLFTNAHFHLLENNRQTASAVLVENGKIIDILYSNTLKPGNAEIIDLKGLHVYPGFIDTHTHSFEGGLYSQSVDLSAAKNIKMVLAQLDDYINKCNKSETPVIDAFRYDENSILEKRFPTVAELDSVCPDIPLVLRRVDGHSSIINSIAWNNFCAANEEYLRKQTTDTNRSTLLVNAGVLRGDINDKVVHWYLDNLPDHVILKAYSQASKIAAANGITTVHTMVGDSQNSISHYNLIRDNLSGFDTEYLLYPQSFNIKSALDAGAKRIGGCILADGALGSHTAALLKPYTDESASNGLLYHSDEYWEKFITTSHKHGLQVAVHCIGDRAIKQINDIYLRLFKDKNHDLRHELIHCELTPVFLINEIAESHAVPVMQPAFDLYWGGENRFYQNVLGQERALEMNRFHNFQEKGVKCTGGSDWYITELDALQGIRAAVHHHNPSERIDVVSAINLYTKNAAWLSHDEGRLGCINIGYDADFACLNENLLTKQGLETAKVIATYKKGNQVFQHE